MDKCIEINMPRNIEDAEKTINYISNLWFSFKKHSGDKIILDFCHTRYIDILMFTPLTMVLYKLAERNKVFFRNFFGEDETEKEYLFFEGKLLRIEEDNILRNASFKFFLANRLDDFNKYLKHIFRYFDFEGKFDAYKTISQCLMEVFINTQHAESFFVTISWKYDNSDLEFIIGNFGETMRYVIKRERQMQFDKDSEAILWALKLGNTTKTNLEIGGVGLYFVDKTVRNNRGSMEIISGKCFFRAENQYSGQIIKDMRKTFPGTYIVLRFNIREFKNEENVAEIQEIYSLADFLGDN